jgi:hypothetical protein
VGNMTEALRCMYRSKYEKQIFECTRDSTKKIDSAYEMYNLDNKNIFNLKLHSSIVKYFDSINGFIGHDYLLLQSTAYDLLYFALIKEEPLSKDQEGTRKVELLVSFCLFVNCIYSIKEKYLFFIGCENDKGILDFTKSILSVLGIEKIRELFSAMYPEIKKYCDARNDIIHNAYDLSVDNDNEVCITLSSFNCRIDKEYLDNIHAKKSSLEKIA